MHNPTKHRGLIILLFLIVSTFASHLYSQELAIRLLDERGDVVYGRVAYPCFDSLATHRKQYSTKELEQTHYRSGRWIAMTIAPELKDDFRLLGGSNRLLFDVLEWMPKNDDLKFDLFRRGIGKIEMQDWAPSDDAGWRLLLEWHRCQVNRLVDRSHLDTSRMACGINRICAKLGLRNPTETGLSLCMHAGASHECSLRTRS